MRVNIDRERRRKKQSRTEIGFQSTKRYQKECGKAENWKLTKEQLEQLLKLPEKQKTEYLHSISKEETS